MCNSVRGKFAVFSLIFPYFWRIYLKLMLIENRIRGTTHRINVCVKFTETKGIVNKSKSQAT